MDFIKKGYAHLKKGEVQQCLTLLQRNYHYIPPTHIDSLYQIQSAINQIKDLPPKQQTPQLRNHLPELKAILNVTQTWNSKDLGGSQWAAFKQAMLENRTKLFWIFGIGFIPLTIYLVLAYTLDSNAMFWAEPGSVLFKVLVGIDVGFVYIGTVTTFRVFYNVKAVQELPPPPPVHERAVEGEEEPVHYVEHYYIDQVFGTMQLNLEASIVMFKRKSASNLAFGVGLTVIALTVLIGTKYFSEPDHTDWTHFFMDMIPSITLVVFIEILSFYFFRLHRINLNQSSAYEEELIDIGYKLVAVKMALFETDEKKIESVITELMKVDHHKVLSENQESVRVKTLKEENAFHRELIKDIWANFTVEKLTGNKKNE